MLQIQRKFCPSSSSSSLIAKFSTSFKSTTFPSSSTTTFHKHPSSSSSPSSSSCSPSAPFIKPITVQVGAGDPSLYTRLKARHPLIPYPRKVPTTSEEGFKLTVKVADTGHRGGQLAETQTIVALHGTPGYLQHFDVLFSAYASPQQQPIGRRNVRLIAPNLPDFSHTRASGGLFWHTTEEKVAFLRDLLQRRLTPPVATIDCLVAHSMGAQTALALMEEEEEEEAASAHSHPSGLRIRSVALLAPQPMIDPVAPAVRAAAHRLFRLAQSAGPGAAEFWYRLMAAVRLHTRVKSAYRFANTDELLWALTTLLDLQTPASVPRRVSQLANSRKCSSVPVAVQFGSREAIISRRAQLQLLTEYLGVPEERFIHLNFSEGSSKGDQLAKIKAGGDQIKVYYLKDGTHFAHARFAQATVGVIDSLLETVADQEE